MSKIHLWVSVAMKPHDRTEASIGKPPGKQFTKSRIIAVGAMKSSDIRCPPRDSRDCHGQSGAYLTIETLKIADNIS